MTGSTTNPTATSNVDLAVSGKVILKGIVSPAVTTDPSRRLELVNVTV
jgi:hypothetical protein